jgi:thiamine biosynthesis lipoprotein
VSGAAERRSARGARPVVVAFLLIAGTGVACGGNDGETQAPSPAKPAQAKPPAPPPRAPAFSRKRNLMGTVFQITVAGAASPEREKTIDAAFAELERLEQVLSEWIPSSEISRINDSAGAKPVAIGADTQAVLEAAHEVSTISEGAYDVSWAALHGLYDFRPDHHRIPTAEEIKPRLALIDWKSVVVDSKAHTAQLTKKGMRIGTGSIGKGYAMDKARDLLLAGGIKDFMIFGGGQVSIEGTRGGSPWRVGVQHPRKGDYFAFLEADAGSVSTSGDYEHTVTDAQGKRWHHIIDTKTGLPTEGTLSVTVITRDGTHADAYSTACFVLGPEKCLKTLTGAPGNPEVLIVGSDFRLYATPLMAKRLTFTMKVNNGVLDH